MSRLRRDDFVPAELRRRLDAIHAGLLDVHKALIDYERERYEKARGPIANAGEFLQLLINDPWFSWLRAVSALIAQIDEFVSAKSLVDPAAGEALITQARELLLPAEEGNAFARAYQRAIQESPIVAMRHAKWKELAG